MSGGVLEIPAFVIGVAGIFTSCIDAFGYFKLYQNATRDIEVVLLKLDIEKARLLIWGENVGILSARHRDPQLLNEHVAELIKEILRQIQELLTDSDKLRTSYGVRTLDSPLSRAVDYISAKSLAIFQPSASRFLTRNATRLGGFPRGSPAARIGWAIHEREQFQELVNNLSHFVDRLFELINIGRETLDRVIIEDIESIIDVSRLAIVEEATETYPAYSEAARSAKASTEAGTLDRRTIAEHIRDVENISAVHPGTTGDHAASDSESHLSEIQYRAKYFALTSPCRRQATNQPCDVRLFGSQVADMESNYGVETPRWDISSRNGTSRNTIGDLVYRAINVNKVIRDEVESGILSDLLKLGTTDRNNEATPEQEALIQAMLPLISLYIYCSPCVCLVHTAISICKRLQSPYVTVKLRPDSRLVSSCCSTVDRTLGMRSLGEWVRDWEANATRHSSSILATHLDTVWLDQRLDCLDYELPYDVQERPDSSLRFLILGEADYVSHMVQKAPGRIPKVTDIWHFEPIYMNVKRTFFGRFIEHGPVVKSPETPRVQSSNSLSPMMPPNLATVRPQTQGLRRPASPSSSVSASRRRKYEVGAPGVGNERESEESARSEAEEMDI